MSDMNNLHECDGLEGRPRDICKGVSGLPRSIENMYRALPEFGSLPPLPDNAEVAASDHEKSETAQVPLTTWQQAKSVAKAGVDLIKRAGALATQEQIDARMEICRTCEFLQGDVCQLCGCCGSRQRNYENKLAHLDQQCPHKPPKWGPIQ